MSNIATLTQGAHALRLIDDQGLDRDQVTILHLYLPALAVGAKNGTLPGVDIFQAVCEGRIKPESIEPKWIETDGVIYLTITSDGTTGPQWIDRLEGKGFRLSDYAKSVLRSPDFKPTSGVTTEIAILKGALFEDDDRITKKIRAEASRRKLTKLNAEAACLIRENFSDEEIKAMGLIWIVAMHEPIKDSDGDLDLLGAYRVDGSRWLGACYGYPDGRWARESGFAFTVSQVNAKI
jgi:hypothetical protein